MPIDSYNIYRITPTGGSHWVTSDARGAMAYDALLTFAAKRPDLASPGTYFVVRPAGNPDGAQSLFRIAAPVAPQVFDAHLGERDS